MSNPEPLHEYWDRPSPKEMGDSDPNQIFLQVGAALTSWENVEMNMAQILRLFVSSDSSVALSRVYGTLIAGTGRVAAVKAAAEVFFDYRKVEEKCCQRFDLVMKHFSAAGGRRNDIGHGLVTKFTLNGVLHGHFLIAPEYHTSKTRSPSKMMNGNFFRELETNKFASIGSVYRYTAEDIAGFTKKFVTLNDWICDLFSEIERDYPHSANNG